MSITGKHLIGAEQVNSAGKTFNVTDPETGVSLPPDFAEGTDGEVERAARLAEEALDPFRNAPLEKRAAFLETVAEELLALGDELIERASQETALPRARLQAERGRTAGQLRLFARTVREGSFVEARIDRPFPDRTPVPRPDLRQMQIALGPVAVFGASNFPLAFSVAGGDTASALAAGCPVVVKGHPAHPGTSELAGQAVQRAVKKCGLPEGTFCLLQGSTTELGAALARHPLIKALAFTGSLTGGRALFDLAAARPEPIPVYAEMGSVNPIFVLPEALQERGEALAADYVNSVCLGVGQFCTNPGLLFAVKGPAFETFVQTASKCLAQATAGTMLHAGIKRNYDRGVQKLLESGKVMPIGDSGAAAATGCSAAPALLRAEAAALLETPELTEEVFGPASLIVGCDSKQQMLEAARALQGQLTATLHAGAGELEAYRELCSVLERKAGRLLVNGFPTGVEVCDAMNHGGPYPASTDARSTSVGTAAVKRFLRPVCYQDFPQEMLPEALKDANPQGIWRLIDGTLSRGAL